MKNPDPDLVQKAQRGDQEALKTLLSQVEPTVRQWALSHMGDPDTAADLCQEVLLLLLRRISSYRGEARFLTWLFSVTRNQALEELRRRKRHEAKMARWGARMSQRSLSPNSGGVAVDREKMRGLVRVFVEELPPRQREVFQMADLQGMTSSEIGTVLRLSPVSVRGALLKARRALRRKLLEQHPEFVEEYLP